MSEENPRGRVSVAEEIGFVVEGDQGNWGEGTRKRKKFQYHQRPRGSVGLWTCTHRCALYRSCVRSVTGNGFTSVKGDIKKMKNTPELLPTCAGYNYAPSSPPAFSSPPLLLKFIHSPAERGAESPQNSNQPFPLPCDLTPRGVRSQLVLIFRLGSRAVRSTFNARHRERAREGASSASFAIHRADVIYSVKKRKLSLQTFIPLSVFS